MSIGGEEAQKMLTLTPPLLFRVGGNADIDHGFKLRDVQPARGNKERCGFVEFSGASAGAAC